MNWKRANGAACVASIVTSIVLNFALELSARHGLFQLPYGMNVGAFSLLASMVVFIGVSWFYTLWPRAPYREMLRPLWTFEDCLLFVNVGGSFVRQPDMVVLRQRCGHAEGESRCA